MGSSSDIISFRLSVHDRWWFSVYRLSTSICHSSVDDRVNLWEWLRLIELDRLNGASLQTYWRLWSSLIFQVIWLRIRNFITDQFISCIWFSINVSFQICSSYLEFDRTLLWKIYVTLNISFQVIFLYYTWYQGTASAVGSAQENNKKGLYNTIKVWPI